MWFRRSQRSRREVEALYRRTIGMMRGRASRLLGPGALAEEIAQEAFVRFLQGRDVGPELRDEAAYLYRSVTNLALNTLRDHARRTELARQHADSVLPPRELDADDLLTLRQTLARVAPELAEIAAYYYLDGLDHAEIAEVLGMERRTVGRRLERFRLEARRASGAEEEVRL